MCPVVGRIEQAFDLGGGNEKEKLARHLKEHLSEALIECGAFEMLRSSGQHQNPARPSSSPDESTVRLINERLANWSCSFRIDESERRLLLESLASLPVSAWLSMPGLLWRLKRKLKKQETA
jgi:hypothetical protein